jgi:uncharacterized membrane protein (GlpM family)
MTFTEGALRFILGGTLVLLIGLVAKSGRSGLAGIIALFPVITAVSYSFMAKSVDIKIMKDAVFNSMVSLPATLVFLFVFYFCLGRVNFVATLVFSLAAWFIVALIVYLIKP